MSKKPPRTTRPKAAKAKAPRPSRIVLDDRLTIVQAADLHRLLVKRLAEGRQLVVDGTRVEEIDTAILQLLTSLWRTGAQRGIACTWHGASQALRRTAALVGVAEMLQFPNTEPAQNRGHVAA